MPDTFCTPVKTRKTVPEFGRYRPSPEASWPCAESSPDAAAIFSASTIRLFQRDQLVNKNLSDSSNGKTRI